jgi:hypothetical protein
MNRDAFIQHIRERVDASISNCERALGRSLPRKLQFKWISPKGTLVENGIEEEILREVYLGSDKIYPCVDIGPFEEKDGVLVIYGFRAGYSPGPFRKNWAGDDGPFILSWGGKLGREQHA